MSGNSKRRREERQGQQTARKAERSEAYLETNGCWDELQGVYGNCKALLFKYVTLLQHAGDPTLKPFFTTILASSAASLIRIITADLTQLNEELGKIAKQHEGKTGGAKTMEEMGASIQFWEQYQLFIERHSGVLVPNVNQLLEVLAQVEGMREAKLREVAAQDPTDNAPIDVEVKTIANTAQAQIAAEGTSTPAADATVQ